MRRRLLPITPIETLESRRLLSTVLGVDAAAYQYDLNWATIKADGYTFGYEKAVQGTYYINAYYTANIAAAKAAGVKIGSYDFADFSDDPTASANYFWNEIKSTISGDGLSLQPMLDAEKYQTGNEDSWIATWTSVLVADGKTAGFTLQPIVYSYESWQHDYLTSATAKIAPLWFAWPGSTAPTASEYSPWTSYEIWQYGEASFPTTDGEGSVSTDVDQLNGTAAELQNLVVGSGKFASGSGVETTASVKATQNSNGTGSSNTVPGSTGGTVLGLPAYYNNAWYFDVSFTDGVTGWVNETSLVAVTNPPAAPVNSSPANNSTNYATPTLTWNSSTGATSYNVYLNNSEVASGLTVTSYTPSTLATGSYSWYVQAHNPAGNTNGATWNFTIATSIPTATFYSQLPTTGAGVFDFSIFYSNPGNTVGLVNASTFGNGNITVTGPNGYSEAAQYVSASQSGNGNQRSVTYEIDAPNGIWNVFADGTYTVNMNANQVSDVGGGYAAAGSIGTFAVNIPFAYINASSQLVINSTPSNLLTTIVPQGAYVDVISGSSSAQFNPTGFSSVDFVGTSGNDTLTVEMNLGVPVSFDGGAGTDTLNVSLSTLLVSSDLGAATSALSVNVSNSGEVDFSSNEHLSALTLSGNGVALLVPGSGIAVETNTLTIRNQSYLDLGDNALVINSISTSAIDGYLTTGSDGGAWDGPGINSQTAASTLGHSIGFSPGSSLSYTSIDGISFSPTAIVVRYTTDGDANLDGTVNSDDLSLLMLSQAEQQQAVQNNQTPPTVYWYNGDFNYDNQINSDDFGLLMLGSAVQNQQMLS